MDFNSQTQLELPDLPNVIEVTFDEVADELMGNNRFCEQMWFLLDLSQSE